jgi:hypothetical protein
VADLSTPFVFVIAQYDDEGKVERELE